MSKKSRSVVAVMAVLSVPVVLVLVVCVIARQMLGALEEGEEAL